MTDASASKENDQMSRDTSTTLTPDTPAAIRPAALRSGLALAVLAAMTAFAVRAQAQQGPSPSALDNLRHVVNANAQTNPLGSRAIGLGLAQSDGRVDSQQD
jgi:hypothetical protein